MCNVDAIATKDENDERFNIMKAAFASASRDTNVKIKPIKPKKPKASPKSKPVKTVKSFDESKAAKVMSLIANVPVIIESIGRPAFERQENIVATMAKFNPAKLYGKVAVNNTAQRMAFDLEKYLTKDLIMYAIDNMGTMLVGSNKITISYTNHFGNLYKLRFDMATIEGTTGNFTLMIKEA